MNSPAQPLRLRAFAVNAKGIPLEHVHTDTHSLTLTHSHTHFFLLETPKFQNAFSTEVHLIA